MNEIEGKLKELQKLLASAQKPYTAKKLYPFVWGIMADGETQEWRVGLFAKQRTERMVKRLHRMIQGGYIEGIMRGMEFGQAEHQPRKAQGFNFNLN